MGGITVQIGAYIVSGLALVAVISIVYTSLRNGITPMPSSLQVRRAVAGELNRLAGDGSAVEAGSGWGTLLFHLCRHCPGWRFTGVENSLVPLWISRMRAWLVSRFIPADGVSRGGVPVIIRGDIYGYPFGTADAVVCYLYPGAMKRLSPLLRQQLGKGGTVVSVCFALPDWQADRVITCADLYRTKIYVYTSKG